ncbi:MAG TPA: hypothetical protein VGP72_30535 [Planctomycetota bacterium]|jgi:hypothetical protein
MYSKTLLLCSLACALATLGIWAAEGDESRLIYKTPTGTESEVTAEGLCRISFDGRDLAKGSWSAWNADGWFKGAGPNKVKARTIQEKSITVLGADHARVRQVKDDLLCTFDYSFSGEDVTISARIENNNPDEAMGVTGFSGLKFTFGKIPTGLMMNQHVSYFQAHGVGLCHPGHWSKIGGSYATDDAVGVGLSPWKTGLTRTLILWDYTDWNPDKREKLPDRNPMYFVVSTIPPRGAQTFDLKMRVSPDRDWKHLLEPYREHFQKTFGAVQYKADNRWISTDYLNHSQAAISPTNPYGFHGGHRRIDTTEGTKQFCDLHIAALKENGGQGVIVWGQGGDDPRGGMYRPDFDVIPPEVEANWPTIAQRLKDAGLRLGVTTRPRDMAVRDNWKSDSIIDINPENEGHRAMIWKRFKTMMDKGCTLFYLDSFGSSYEDVILMRFLRGKMGPDILTFCEHQCDAIFPYSGGYSECTLDARNPEKCTYGVWSGTENWEIYRWLTPGAQLASRVYETKGKPPANVESPDKFFLSHHITTLLPAFDNKRAQALKGLEGEFLDEKGQWKNQ